MINKISIKNAASFGERQQDLVDLRKTNFVYGSNGTGKTTISRIIANTDPNIYTDCSVSWSSDQPMKRLVYNRDFINDNFAQPEELKGVFTLGKKGKEIEQKIKSERARLDQIRDTIDRHQNSLSDSREALREIEGDFANSCWELRRRFGDTFREAFIGVLGSKVKFKNRLLKESISNQFASLPLKDMEVRAKTLFGASPTSQDPVKMPVPARRMLSHEVNPILLKKVIGKSDVDIADLIEKLDNSDWVMRGRKYYDPNERICPFCQQETAATLEKSLEDYFDEAFQADTAAISSLLNDYKSDSKDVMQELEEIQNDISGRLDDRLDKVEFKSQCDLLESKINWNLSQIKRKQRQASVRIHLDPLGNIFAKIRKLLDSANAKIQDHNRMVANFGAEKVQLRGQVWRYLLDHEIKGRLAPYKRRKTGLKKGIEGLETRIKNQNREIQAAEKRIAKLEEGITSIQPTVDAINGMLKSFDFKGFKLVQSSKKGFYRIRREDGSDVEDTLSEGEKSFIAFLYFYHLLKGSTSRSGVTADRIVVFDDPVSSLDSQVLFVVSSLIRGLFKDVRDGSSSIKQVFVFTHNVYFQKEVTYRRGRDARGSACNDETFWIVEKTEDHSRVKLRDKIPARTNYELLWSEVRRAKETSISLPNTLRRILEYYFKILGKYRDLDDVCKEFSSSERIVCRALLSWVNEGSHAVFEGIDFSDTEMVEMSLPVFKKIFKNSGHSAHYEMMMGNENLGNGDVNEQ